MAETPRTTSAIRAIVRMFMIAGASSSSFVGVGATGTSSFLGAWAWAGRVIMRVARPRALVRLRRAAVPRAFRVVARVVCVAFITES
jgi:hypothetical protein